MRRLCGASLLLLAICATAPAQDSMPIPWANKFFVFKDTPAVIVHDFGTVPQGTILTHRFTITNIYAVPMQVSDPRVSCGCTSGNLSKRILQPRESGQLEVVMDARRFSGHKAVTVWVDFGPQFRSTAVLRVQANARTDIAINPGRIDFGAIAQGRKVAQSVELQYLGGMANWQLTHVVVDDKGPVEVAVQPSRQRANSYVVTAVLKPDAPAGPVQAEIQLQTNDPNNPVITVGVGGSIQAPFEVQPKGPVRWNAVPVGGDVATSLIIVGTKPFKIEKIEGEGDGVTAQQLLPQVNERQVVKVRFQPQQAGTVSRVLKLYTDANSFVTIPVEATAINR